MKLFWWNKENGIATFNDENLPLGKYYIKELTAPKGYATNPEIIDIDGTYAGQEVDKIEKQVDFTNIMTKLKIRIVDDETDVDLADTQLVLKDEEGNVIGTYTIDDSGEIEVKGLEKGKQYKIEEIEQRYGYVKDLLFKNEEDPNELTKEKDNLTQEITKINQELKMCRQIKHRNEKWDTEEKEQQKIYERNKDTKTILQKI